MASSELHCLFLKEQAMQLYTYVFLYLVKNKPNNALADFPESSDGIPWRRIYAELQAYVTTGLMDVPWSPNELSRGGTGSRWYFTLLPRSGEKGEGNIIRRTDDGQSWSSRTGRGPKKGYPRELLVDKLLMTDCFEMLELTDSEKDKPIVALCKISRKKKTTGAQQLVMVASLHSEVGASSSQQTDDLSNISRNMQQMMEIDQIQQANQESPLQQIVPISQLVQMNDNHFGASSEGTTIVGTPPMGKDTFSIFQEALSFIVSRKDEFEKIQGIDQNAANIISSALQTAASNMSNALGNAAATSSSTPPVQLQISVQAEPPTIYPNQAAVQDEAVDDFLDLIELDGEYWINVNNPGWRAD